MNHHDTTTVTACIAAVLLSTAAMAEGPRDAIDAQNRALEAAMRAGDAAAVGALYTDDAVVIPPGANIASGRPAITAFWKESIAAGIKDVVLHTATLDADGDLALEVGAVTIIDNENQKTEARYLVVWKRVDGGWKLHRDVWNAR